MITLLLRLRSYFLPQKTKCKFGFYVCTLYFLVYPSDMSSVLMFSERDWSYLISRGINRADAKEQVRLLEKKSSFVELSRPCTVDDGIVVLNEDQKLYYEQLFTQQQDRHFLKHFVPSSGAASRMFKKVYEYREGYISESEKREIERNLFEKLNEYALFDPLKSIVLEHGLDLSLMLKDKQFLEVASFMIDRKGLFFSETPKALIPFHRSSSGTSTALSEHFKISANVQSEGVEKIRLHFTILPKHQEMFEREILKCTSEHPAGGRFVVDFSFQAPSTDTISMDFDGKLIRTEEKQILLRPGGHGSLIRNLNQIEACFAFVQNIDNVQSENFHTDTVFWKKTLGGLAIELKNLIDQYAKQLNSEGKNSKLRREIFQFLKKYFCFDVSADEKKQINDEVKFLENILNRPMRVCGVVKNDGQVGGGPFWVNSQNKKYSRIQIVESAQVNMSDDQQKQIFNRSSHFNPVNMVCSLRDVNGEKFDLEEFVDSEAVFISTKSLKGKDFLRSRAARFVEWRNGRLEYLFRRNRI